MDEISSRATLRKQSEPTTRRSRGKWVAVAGVVLLILAVGFGRLFFFNGQSGPQGAAAQSFPEVTVSKPLERQIDRKLTFLGQFSAVDRVELRGAGRWHIDRIYFKDGAIVRKGDLLFTIDTEPYAIKLAQAQAQLKSANAQMVLANQELTRAQSLASRSFGTVESVDQRTSDLQGAAAAIDAPKRLSATPNLISITAGLRRRSRGASAHTLFRLEILSQGSRAATSPTTLLATLVSLDPIHLDFDMSESDYETFSHYRAQAGGAPGKSGRACPSTTTTILVEKAFLISSTMNLTTQAEQFTRERPFKTRNSI